MVVECTLKPKLVHGYSCMTSALLFVAVLLILGVALRQGLPLFRWLYIPASVIAGFLGLAAVQAGHAGPGVLKQWAATQSDLLSDWPGWLIAVVFAGMLIDRKPMRAGESVRRVARQGLMVWVIVLGETAVGLLAVWLLIQGAYDVPNSLGMLIETGFAGGHGTAAAMGEVFAHPSVNLDGGKDLGMLMATFGLVFGIVSGILWINIGVRQNWISSGKKKELGTGSSSPESIGQAKISGDTIDPLLLQVIWLALAFGVGILMQFVVMQAAATLDVLVFGNELGHAAGGKESLDAARQELSQRLTISNVVDFPLFIYTLFGGLLVQRALRNLSCDRLIDGATIGRLTSTAMDVLIVAAIASLNLSVVAALAVPFLILFCCGAAWTAFCLLVLARWMLPSEYWFQLGLINYGMSTGTTATGFVLLKMVDPDLTSGAAEDYALAAPLSAPFVGGGMITIALPLLVLERVNIAIPALAIAAIVVALVIIGARSHFANVSE